MKVLIMAVWCVLINLFIVPLCLYGSTFTPDSLDGMYAIQLFLAMLSGIIIHTLTENYFTLE